MPSQSLKAWVKRFLESYLPYDKEASMHTIESYACALKAFLGFLKRKRGPQPSVRDITAENVLAFLRELETKRAISSSTRNARLAAILSFHRYAHLMGPVEKSAFERLRHIAFKRKPFGIAPHLEVTELRAIYRAVDHSTHDGFRDLTILKTLYNTGVRASELADIRISNLALDNLHVTIFGKGGKQRLCGLWQTTATLIRIYLASERRVPVRGYEDYLFISQRRKPFTRFGIRDIVRRYATRAAESCPSLRHKTVTAHTYRHTTGVHLVDAGVDLNTTRELLGHAHMSTTEIYARANLRTRRRALAKLEQIDQKLFEEVISSREHPQLSSSIKRWLASLKE
jgi:site-specific recombinase XerD